MIKYTVTINASNSTFDVATSCNPADTGTVSQTFVNQFGCDSVHTITTTLDLVSSSNQSVTGCDSAAAGGTTYYASTTFSDTIIGGSASGCDSVINYTVTINASNRHWPAIRHLTFRHRAIPADTGTVSQTFVNQFGCDSVHTVTTRPSTW